MDNYVNCLKMINSWYKIINKITDLENVDWLYLVFHVRLFYNIKNKTFDDERTSFANFICCIKLINVIKYSYQSRIKKVTSIQSKGKHLSRGNIHWCQHNDFIGLFENSTIVIFF